MVAEKGRPTMTADQLCEALGITADQLAAFVRAGMPSKGRGKRRRFDPDLVGDWLLTTGRATLIVSSLAEVGRHFGVSERTAAGWRAKGMPGEPGAYDIDRIEQWRDQGESTTTNRFQAELMRIRAQRELLELEREQEKLIPVDEPIAFMAKTVTLATIYLEQMVERFPAHLPESMTPEVWQKVRSDAVQLMRDKTNRARQCIADALEEWGSQTEATR